jgi:hypothetical protein
MKDLGGLLIFFDEGHRQSLIKERVDGGYENFSDALSVSDWEIGQRCIALMGFSESNIDYIALVKRGKRIVTSKFRAEFSEIVNLDSIRIGVLESRLKENIKRYFIRSSRGVGGLVPVTTWQAVIKLIKEERPNVAGDIDRLLSLQRYSGFLITGEVAEILLQEREALGAALDIFSGGNQIRERVLSAWAPHEDSVSIIDESASVGILSGLATQRSSLLRGIPGRYLQEESALQHDLFNWNGATPIHEAGLSVFEQGGRQLEVIYANRNKLEQTLGVDLIYYNETYELFALVQYKLMREVGNKMVYRPDEQLNKEISRMDEFCNQYLQSVALQSHEAYRLNSDGFFLKLVPNKGLRPAAGELIKGMYLTREYARFLLSRNGTISNTGVKPITFDNAPRYMTNTEFTQAIHRGWIGTRGVQSDVLKELIKRYYETGRAVLLAYETKIVNARHS